MNFPPLTIDGLLSDKPATHALERLGRTLRDFLQHDSDAGKNLQRLEAGLKSTLLKVRNIEALTSTNVLGALAQIQEQQELALPSKDGIAEEIPVDPRTGGHKSRLPSDGRHGRHRAATKGGRKSRQAPPGRATGSPEAQSASNSRSRGPGGLRTGGQVKLAAEKPENRVRPSSKSDPQAERKSQAGIDAARASSKMAKRAKKAGMGAAWNSVINTRRRPSHGTGFGHHAAPPQAGTSGSVPLHHGPARHNGFAAKSAYQYSVETAGSGVEEARQGLQAAADRLEHKLKDLIGQIVSKAGTADRSIKSRNKSYAESDQREKLWNKQPLAGKIPFERGRKQASTGFDDQLVDSDTKNRNTQGGLRGLVARTGSPLDDSDSKMEAGQKLPQGKKHLPEPGTGDQATRQSGSSLSEIADLLAEEARRAGINLEQFRP